MTERVQLKEPGSELLLHVTAAKPETVDQAEYWLFIGSDKEIMVPASSVKGRLERMGVTDAPKLVGKTVKFARSMKTTRGGKPFWEMDIVAGNGTPIQSTGGGMDKPTTGTSASVPPVEAAPSKPTMRAAYKALTEWVISEIAPLYHDAEFGFPPEVIASCTATLFIQACKSGKVE